MSSLAQCCDGVSSLVSQSQLRCSQDSRKHVKTVVTVSKGGKVNSSFWGPSRFRKEACQQSCPIGRDERRSREVRIQPVRALRGGRKSRDSPQQDGSSSPGRTLDSDELAVQETVSDAPDQTTSMFSFFSRSSASSLKPHSSVTTPTPPGQILPDERLVEASTVEEKISESNPIEERSPPLKLEIDQEDTLQESERRAAEKLLSFQLDTNADVLVPESNDIKAEMARKVKENEAAVLARAEELVILEREREEISSRKRAEERVLKLKKLQEGHEFIAAKMFFYPEVVKAGEALEIFFHRPASALQEKPSIFAMGAYNDWSWQPFKAELKPSSDILNDWWTCTLCVPREAYKLNVVFHSNDNVYENNEGADFFISVVGKFDEEKFETMLNERKREEAERKAAEEAEKERIAREERRKAEIKAQEEADLKAAKNEAEEKRRILSNTRMQLPNFVDGIWYTQPPEIIPDDEVTVFYNRTNRPLHSSAQVWLHVGWNNWQVKTPVPVQMQSVNSENGDWWSGTVAVPRDSVVMNWVIADGPPGQAVIYDNNNRQDYAAPVGGAQHAHEVFSTLEESILWRLKKERKEREEIEAAKAAKRAELKVAMKARTKEAFYKSQAHVFYTEPVEPQAGEIVTVYYNPTNTALHGRQQVWMRGSFNRWTHRSGCFMPLPMSPAPNGTHFMAQVKVPLDSYIMDLVFLDNADANSATYDNRGGLDYHVPVVGGSVKEPPLYVVHVALEMAPIAKVGGLGDVVTSLSRAMIELGHQVEVILPKYDCLKYNYIQGIEERGDFFWGGTKWRIWFGFVEGIGVNFIEPENGIFWVGCIYGRKDDGARFGSFCNAALEFLLQTGRKPDIIHCHDWSSAPVAWLHSEQYSNYGLASARTVFTIHNLEFGQALIGRAMAACNKATTVSPTYAAEISGHGAVAAHLGKFYGIVNGIDPDIWDPMADPFIPMQYGPNEVVEGKLAAKRALWNRLNLRHEERPLVGIVTRLTHQKGIHLIKHAIWRTIDRGGQVVLLGSAPDGRVQAEFEALARELAISKNDMARLWLSYDEPLSHLIYAAADMILVPSIFEPCGLTQLIAMRYGAIPVVRKTGGLNDTVFDVDNDKERAAASGKGVNGFSFEGTDAGGIDYALNRAISGWYEGREWWKTLSKQVMEQDWTWNRPALDYLELYYGARK